MIIKNSVYIYFIKEIVIQCYIENIDFLLIKPIYYFILLIILLFYFTNNEVFSSFLKES